MFTLLVFIIYIIFSLSLDRRSVLTGLHRLQTYEHCLHDDIVAHEQKQIPLTHYIYCQLHLHELFVTERKKTLLAFLLQCTST